MREAKDEETAFVNETIDKVFMRNCLEEWEWCAQNPYLFEVEVPVSEDEARVLKAFNEQFHALAVLPKGTNLGIGEARDYCAINVNDDRETYSALFNVPSAKEFTRDDEEDQYTLKAMHVKETAGRIAAMMVARQNKATTRSGKSV